MVFYSVYGTKAPEMMFQITIPPGATALSLDTCDTGFDTLLYVTKTCPAGLSRNGANLTPLKFNDDGSCGNSMGGSKLVISNPPSGPLYITVDGYSATDKGNFKLRWDITAPSSAFTLPSPSPLTNGLCPPGFGGPYDGHCYRVTKGDNFKALGGNDAHLACRKAFPGSSVAAARTNTQALAVFVLRCGNTAAAEPYWTALETKKNKWTLGESHELLNDASPDFLSVSTTGMPYWAKGKAGEAKEKQCGLVNKGSYLAATDCDEEQYNVCCEIKPYQAPSASPSPSGTPLPSTSPSVTPSPSRTPMASITPSVSPTPRVANKIQSVVYDCPAGWQLVESKCYRLIPTNYKGTEADAACAALNDGATLASVGSLAQATAVIKNYCAWTMPLEYQGNKNYWIGLYDQYGDAIVCQDPSKPETCPRAPGSAAARSYDGWAWLNGQDASWWRANSGQYWSQNEPNNYFGGERCTQVYHTPHIHEVNDMACHYSYFPCCEMAATASGSGTAIKAPVTAITI